MSLRNPPQVLTAQEGVEGLHRQCRASSPSCVYRCVYYHRELRDSPGSAARRGRLVSLAALSTQSMRVVPATPVVSKPKSSAGGTESASGRQCNIVIESLRHHTAGVQNLALLFTSGTTPTI